MPGKRQIFADRLLALMTDDDRIVVLLGDIGVYLLREHRRRWPMRVWNIGICEQAMVGIGAGLAMAGFYPVMVSIEAFLLRRAYEQIYLDFGVQQQRGLFVGFGGANEYEKLGPTHRCPEGPAMMYRVPGMVSSAPLTDGPMGVERAVSVAVRDRLLAFIRLEERGD